MRLDPYTILMWLFFIGLFAALYARSHEIFICVCVLILLHIVFIYMYNYMINSAHAHDVNHDD